MHQRRWLTVSVLVVFVASGSCGWMRKHPFKTMVYPTAVGAGIGGGMAGGRGAGYGALAGLGSGWLMLMGALITKPGFRAPGAQEAEESQALYEWNQANGVYDTSGGGSGSGGSGAYGGGGSGGNGAYGGGGGGGGGYGGGSPPDDTCPRLNDAFMACQSRTNSCITRCERSGCVDSCQYRCPDVACMGRRNDCLASCEQGFQSCRRGCGTCIAESQVYSSRCSGGGMRPAR